jgi:hypothetical protein
MMMIRIVMIDIAHTLAAAVGITERAAHRILSELVEEGYDGESGGSGNRRSGSSARRAMAHTN